MNIMKLGGTSIITKPPDIDGSSVYSLLEVSDSIDDMLTQFIARSISLHDPCRIKSPIMPLLINQMQQ